MNITRYNKDIDTKNKFPKIEKGCYFKLTSNQHGIRGIRNEFRVIVIVT